MGFYTRFASLNLVEYISQTNQLRPQLCLGPVCVPLHLLIPFLLTLAHQRGWLLFIKREWVTFRYWKELIIG